MQQEVINVIAQLVSENKEPSVALVKSRLITKTPMPVIIAVLGQYKKDPKSILNAQAQPNNDAPTKEDLSQSQLDRIEAKLDKLLTLLEKS